MKFPYDYVVLSALPAFFVGMCVGALITAAAAIRWLRKHGLGRLVGEEEGEEARHED